MLKNLNGSQQLPRSDLELVKIEPGTRKGLIFIIKNLKNDRIDHYMSYNQPDALSNFRLQCRWVSILINSYNAITRRYFYSATIISKKRKHRLRKNIATHSLS